MQKGLVSLFILAFCWHFSGPEIKAAVSKDSTLQRGFKERWGILYEKQISLFNSCCLTLRCRIILRSAGT